jgi:hypothetical protein
MTRHEFAKIAAYISVATNQPLTHERMEVYFDLLGELPAPMLEAAAKKAVLSHPWATFPSAAELREACVDVMQGDVVRMTAARAWEIAWSTAGCIDLEVPHTHAFMDSVPPLVAKAMRTFGLPALIYGKEPVGVVRAQFMKIYEQLDEADKRRSLLPAPLAKQITEYPKIAGHLANFGAMPPDPLSPLSPEEAQRKLNELKARIGQLP